MSSSSDSRLTKYVSATTIVTSDVANMWYGGLYGSSDAYMYDPDHPLVSGHVHDGEHVDGHAQKINLVNHVTDQLTNPNIADNAVTPRTVNYYADEENAIPYITDDGDYKLNLSMIEFGAFVEDVDDNLIRTRNKDYNHHGYNFVFGSSSLDDIGVGAAGLEDGDFRLLFDRRKGAFRAGAVFDVQSDRWDDINRGYYSVSIGINSLVSGAASVSFGSTHSVEGSYSGSLSGSHGSIDIDSSFSVIAGGKSNEIYSGVDSSIAGGAGNRINDAQGSSIFSGVDNYIFGNYSAAGGRGMFVEGGSGTFVWGYDDSPSGGTNPVLGDRLFVIGTGHEGGSYKVGINTNEPDMSGGIGAEIVGSTDNDATPLRLTNLHNNDSRKALCVDEGTGDVYVSNYELCEECILPGSIDRTQVITFESWASFGSTDRTVQSWRYRSVAQSPAPAPYAHMEHVSPWGSDTNFYPSIPALVFPYQWNGEEHEGPLATIRFTLNEGETLSHIVLFTDADIPEDFSHYSKPWRLKVSRIRYRGGEHEYLIGSEGNNYVQSKAPSFSSNPGWDGTNTNALGQVYWDNQEFGTIVGDKDYIYLMTIAPVRTETNLSYDDRVWFVEVETETSPSIEDFIRSPRATNAV